MFVYTLGVSNGQFISVIRLIFELQTMFDVLVTKELTGHLYLYQAQKYAWKINYTLAGGEIHGKQNEHSFSFLNSCIGKSLLVVEVLFPIACVHNSSVSYPLPYLHDGLT